MRFALIFIGVCLVLVVLFVGFNMMGGCDIKAVGMQDDFLQWHKNDDAQVVIQKRDWCGWVFSYGPWLLGVGLLSALLFLALLPKQFKSLSGKNNKVRKTKDEDNFSV